MTKFLKRTCLLLALLLCCTFVFVGCGPEEDVDATLYKLRLSADINLTETQKAELKPTLAFNEDGTGSRDEYEIEQLEKKGADVSKAGTSDLDENGKFWYFFDGDPMFIDAPTVQGYVFKGFYYKNTPTTGTHTYKKYYYDNDGNLHTSRWNMENKEVELVAHYDKFEYVINYGLDVLEYGIGDNPANGYLYDDMSKVITLNDPIAPKGKSFVRWYCDLGYGKTKTVTTLPREYDEREELVYATTNGYAITLFAEFEDVYYPMPTITVKDTAGNTITLKDEDLNITLKDSAGTPITEPVDSYKYGTTISVRVNAITGYELDGIYVNDAKHTNNYLENHILEENDKIEIILKAELWNVYFHFNKDLIPSSLGDVCSDMTISGVSTYVDDVLASSATTLTESSTVKANYNTSFTVRFKLQSNLSFDKLTIGEDEITPTQNGEYYEFTYTVAGQYYPEIYLYVVAE